MHTLIFSISCSVAVSILLKMARRHDLDVGQAIAFNYVLAAGLCVWLLGSSPVAVLESGTQWGLLLALGVLLPSIFLAMAGAVRHAGIVLSDAAQRLSLLIPLLASFVIFGEAQSAGKLAGIALALLALILLLVRPGAAENRGADRLAVPLLLTVWVGYGTIDILFKQLARSGALFANSLLAAFLLAGALMFLYLFLKKTRWKARNVAAGLLLGLLNFGNIYFYIRAHQTFPQNPTLVFSSMNIGVISLGALIGAGVFKEPLSRLNIAGIALAIVAILLLMPR